MKKVTVLIVCLFAITILQWCTSWWVKTKVDWRVNALIKKDQEKQQWFILTKDELYASYDQVAQNIDLRDKGLVAIPDLCLLLDDIHEPFVKYVNLASNKITLANQDLSCLTSLHRLNLAYNDIEVIGDLWDLPSLEELYLQKNSISSTKSFPTFPGLKKLNLSYNKLKEVKWLDHLKTLVTLEMAHNQIEKIVWIEKLEQLKELKVEFNKLKELNSVDDLLELELVTAKGNQLKASFVEKLNKLNEEYVKENFGEVWTKIGEVLIEEVVSSIDNDNSDDKVEKE